MVNEQQEKEKNLLTNYVLRIDSECRKKENTENLIEKIAAEERELINRLKKSQIEQEEVRESTHEEIKYIRRLTDNDHSRPLCVVYIVCFITAPFISPYLLHI